MRYINLQSLDIESDWVGRATQAAKEVEAASPGQRAKIIDKHQRLWKELKDRLSELSYGKCWYCESVDARSDNAVDHYRPKGNVRDAEPAHDGYWWLAFDWQNYRFSCTFCNSLRRSATTVGGKQDYFPLWDEQRRARSAEDDIEDENPLLLDPTNPLDTAFIAFGDDGSVGPCVEEGEDLPYRKGERTVRHYHLNHPTLVERRMLRLRQVRQWVMEADKHLARHIRDGDGYSRSVASARLKDIIDAKDVRGEYSMAVVHLLTAMRGNSETADTVFKA